mgnify:CR=1 FL=1
MITALLSFQMAAYALVAIAFIGALIYYIAKRGDERKKEDFERRDN